jgi:hypothetical protein
MQCRLARFAGDTVAKSRAHCSALSDPSPSEGTFRCGGLGEDGERLVQDGFGHNYSRPQAIKQKYDPDNLFRFNAKIQPKIRW